MKKLFFVTALAAIGFLSNAQVKFGGKLGANFYTLGGDDVEDSDVKGKIGFHFGFLANIPVTEHFSVQPEVVYSIQGAKLEDLDGVNGDRVNINLNYLNVPVLLQFTSDGGFYGELGPQFGFLMSAKADYKIGGISSDDDIKDDVKSIDFSVALGTGYKCKNGFGVGARYNLGLSNLNDDDSGDLKNRGFQLGVFYMFGGSKMTKGK